MCCSEAKANQVNVECPNDEVEIRKGRWLRIVHRNPDSFHSSSNHVLQSHIHSSVVRVNSWLGNETENRILPAHDLTLNKRTNKIVIFFIHGVGGSSEVWHEQMDYFSKLGYFVIAPDILGHGGSSAPRNESSYSFSELAHDIFAVFDRYRSETRNILIGHSYGCSFCTKIASQRPRQVSKMVLISGGGPVPLNPQPCQLFCLPSFVLACLKPFVLWSFRRRGFHTHTFQDSIQSSHAFKVPSYVLRATMMGQTWIEGDEQFHSDLMVATLLIYGNHDSFVTIEEEKYMHEEILQVQNLGAFLKHQPRKYLQLAGVTKEKQLVNFIGQSVRINYSEMLHCKTLCFKREQGIRTIYGSTLEVLENAGHMVMLECPEKVNELILQFLQRDVSTQSEYLLAGDGPGCSAVSDVKNTASTIHESQLSLNNSSLR